MINLSGRFGQLLERQHIISPGERVFVACSGGPDSVALFSLLDEMKDLWDLKLGLLHFHHGIRGRAADRDADFVRDLAQKFEIPFYSGRCSVLKKARTHRESVEEAARRERYLFFAKAAKRYRISKIALAHTLDDQAETVLMRILQGTGLRGLSGIQRIMKIGKCTLVRPLLDFSKREILDYLRKGKIVFCRDRSNESLRFLRNRVRRRLLPQLKKEFNPRIIHALARIPVIVQDENQWTTGLEQEAFQRILKRRVAQRIYLDRDAFVQSGPALQFRILNRSLQMLDAKSGMDFDAWQRLRLHLTRKRFRYSLPRDIDLALSPSRVTIYKKFPKVR